MDQPIAEVGHSAGRPRLLPRWSGFALPFALAVALAAVALSADDGPKAEPDPVADLSALEQAFQQVAERLSPSVVGISSRRRCFWALSTGEGDGAAATFEQYVVINGSGTVIRDDGSILTNEHVVRGAGEIEVVLHDGRKQSATVVAADARSDLAILRVDVPGLPSAKLCDWETVSRGQWSIALGNPFGLGGDGNPSVSVGVIANLGRHLPGLGEVDDRLYADMIQTTAAIQPGNSGGPLFNLRGELVGVVTAVHARGADDEGVGFAIPMTPARQSVVELLLEGRSVPYGYLGLTVRGLKPSESSAAGLEPVVGVLVEKVELGGPAAKAGVRVGDVIARYDGRLIDASTQLAELVGTTSVGTTVALELRRGKQPITVRAVVGCRRIDRVRWMRGAAITWRGMRLANLTVESRRRLKIDPQVDGVVVIDIADNSPAKRARIEIGDVIDQVEDGAVQEVTAFLKHVRGRKDAVRLQVHGRGTVTVAP